MYRKSGFSKCMEQFMHGIAVDLFRVFGVLSGKSNI